MNKRYLSPKDLGEYMGLHVHTIYNWIYKRKIPHHKFDKGIVRFDIKEIDQWIANKKVKKVD